jgi:hypothetical protein
MPMLHARRLFAISSFHCAAGSRMILTTHAIVGASIASFMPSHPIAVAALAFASHFALDAIPHWDYPLRSALNLRRDATPAQSASVYDNPLVRDLGKVGLDALTGCILAVALFATAQNVWVILLGAAAAMLPDPLQVAHKLFPREPLATLQRFHAWIHTNRRMENQAILGILTQTAFAVLVIGSTFALHRGTAGGPIVFPAQ